MALITRFSRLFSADLHAVLDRMEEPELVLKQSIRDMQAAITASERQSQALNARAEHLTQTCDNLAGRLEDATAELAVCLDADNDALARSVIERKLVLERQLQELTRQRERTGAEQQALQRALAERRRELDTLQSQARVFESGAQPPTVATQAATVTREEVEVALLREKQRRART